MTYKNKFLMGKRYKRSRRRGAYKKKYHRRSKRRFNRKKRYTRKRGSIGGYPNSKLVHFRLKQAGYLNAVANLGSNYTYYQMTNPKAMSYDDPHNPVDWSKWATQYNHCIVTKAKVRTHFTQAYPSVQTNVGYTEPVIVAMWHDDDAATTSPNLKQLVEAGRCQWVVLEGTNNAGKTLRTSYYPRKSFGIKDLKDNMDMLGCTTVAGTTPAEEWFIKIGAEKVYPVYGTGEVAAAVTYNTIIDMWVLFTEKIEQIAP